MGTLGKLYKGYYVEMGEVLQRILWEDWGSVHLKLTTLAVLDKKSVVVKNTDM